MRMSGRAPSNSVPDFEAVRDAPRAQSLDRCRPQRRTRDVGTRETRCMSRILAPHEPARTRSPPATPPVRRRFRARRCGRRLGLAQCRSRSRALSRSSRLDARSLRATDRRRRAARRRAARSRRRTRPVVQLVRRAGPAPARSRDRGALPRSGRFAARAVRRRTHPLPSPWRAGGSSRHSGRRPHHPCRGPSLDRHRARRLSRDRLDARAPRDRARRAWPRRNRAECDRDDGQCPGTDRAARADRR